MDGDLPEHVRIDVARCAHAVWCDKMLERGWSPGDRLDDVARTHPGLRPFDAMSAFDQERLADWLNVGNVTYELIDAVDSAMTDSEIGAHDIEPGTLVEPTDCPPDVAPVVGKVIDWQMRRPSVGLLSSVRVQWPNGDIGQHASNELQLATPPPTSPAS